MSNNHLGIPTTPCNDLPYPLFVHYFAPPFVRNIPIFDRSPPLKSRPRHCTAEHGPPLWTAGLENPSAHKQGSFWGVSSSRHNNTRRPTVIPGHNIVLGLQDTQSCAPLTEPTKPTGRRPKGCTYSGSATEHRTNEHRHAHSVMSRQPGHTLPTNPLLPNSDIERLQVPPPKRTR